MSKEFWIAVFHRALHAVAQSALAFIGTAMFVEEVNWIRCLSAGLIAGIISVLTSIAVGVPEAEKYRPTVTVKAYDDYTEDGSPVVEKPESAWTDGNGEESE